MMTHHKYRLQLSSRYKSVWRLHGENLHTIIHTCHTSPLDWLSLRWHLCACRRRTSCCWISFRFSGSAVDVAVVGAPPCAPPGVPPWVAAWGPGWPPLGAPDCGWAGEGAGGVACWAIPPSFPPTPTTDEPPNITGMPQCNQTVTKVASFNLFSLSWNKKWDHSAKSV